MACVLLVSKEKINDPKKWFSNILKSDSEWEKDEYLEEYKNGNIYLSSSDEFYRFEDRANDCFSYWETKKWLDLAEDNEIIYGYYSEDDLSAEFVHIKDSKCIREYRKYSDDESDNVDEGTLPAFASWVDVAAYVDKEMN